MANLMGEKRERTFGFSLLEIMIVMAIGSILILGIAQMANYQSRISKTGELDKQLDDIKRQFQTWIFNQSFCDASFAGLRNGESPEGIRRNSIDPPDYIIKTGDRFPGSDWTIDSFTLLDRATIRDRFPQFSAGVNDQGLGTGVLQVVLRQLRRGTTNTKLEATEDTGAFKSIRKELFFPINAKFGHLINPQVPVTAINGNMALLRSNEPSGFCCQTCTVPGQSYTYEGLASQQPKSGVGPQTGLGTPSNPLYFSSSADLPALPPNPLPASTASGFSTPYYDFECYMYHIDYAIIECVSPSGASI